MTIQSHDPCPLCLSDRARAMTPAHGRHYFDCDVCGLVHMARAERLGPADEQARYDQHRNDPADPRYRAFLSRAADPLVERVAPGATGLDYGSGPGPTLSVMLEEAGLRVATYDPIYSPDPEPLTRAYDFITCTETAEHFFDPAAELRRLDGMLRPGGWLAIMTEMLDEGMAFGEWWYARDPTHVCFYRPRTMEWIAARFGWSLERPAPSVALFRKPPG